jgi:hypothetical protein
VNASAAEPGGGLGSDPGSEPDLERVKEAEALTWWNLLDLAMQRITGLPTSGETSRSVTGGPLGRYITHYEGVKQGVAPAEIPGSSPAEGPA